MTKIDDKREDISFPTVNFPCRTGDKSVCHISCAIDFTFIVERLLSDYCDKVKTSETTHGISTLFDVPIHYSVNMLVWSNNLCQVLIPRTLNVVSRTSQQYLMCYSFSSILVICHIIWFLDLIFMVQ